MLVEYMYFSDRVQAGKMLADQMVKFSNQNCAIIALTRGAVLVAEQIALNIHASLMILLSEKIYLPGESDALAGMTADNTFTYNNMFSAGELEEMVGEYFTYIAQRRMENNHRLHSILTGEGEINKDLLRNHIVILVSDGLANGFSLDIAADYLKSIKIKRLVMAVPIASRDAVDRMHLVSDEFFCLSIPGDFFTVDHYYDENKIPTPEEIVRIIKDTPLHWAK